MKLSREQIRKVIELTAMVDPDGNTWGMDTDCGNIEEIIDQAISILKEISKEEMG